MSSASAAPPGWYPDPFGRLPYRWWDGEQWTAYAADTAVQWDYAPLETQTVVSPGVPGLGVALVGVGVGAALSLGIALGLRAIGDPGGVAARLGLSQLGLWTGVLAACLVVSRHRGTGSFARDFDWRVRPRDIGLGFAGSLVARAMAGIAVAPIPAPFFDLRAPDRTIFEEVAGDAAGWWVLVATVVIGAPLIEELFFRGLLQTRLVGRYGVVPGIAVASLLFGAAHVAAWQGPITLLYGLSTAGAGLVLGVMRHATGTLGAPTMAHAFFNAQALIAVALLS